VLDRFSKFVAKWARPGGEEAHQMYMTIAKNARHAEFYKRYDVADTLDGRFDTLTLMAVLVLRRLKTIGDKGQTLGQEVVDLMFADMDLSLHEIGVSENKVGKKVKIMATAFLGRLNAYIDALDSQDDKALAAALSRNLYRDDGANPINNGLIKAIHNEVKSLDEQSDEELLKGRLLSPTKLTG
jgi:cytochrome b pre-mRNA-processing protein 3